MDGWKTRFPLGWPIFRGELLVSGSIILWHQNMPICFSSPRYPYPAVVNCFPPPSHLKLDRIYGGKKKPISLLGGSSHGCKWLIYGGFLEWWYPQIIHLFIGFSIINHPFGGTTIYGNTNINNHGPWLVSPLNRVVVGPFPNGRTLGLINGGEPNHLLTGMILQVGGKTTGWHW